MWWLTFSQDNSTGLETKPMKNCQTNSTCDVNSKTHASTVRWYLVLTQHQDIGSWGGTVMNMSGWSLSTEAYPVTKQKLPQRKVLISMWAANLEESAVCLSKLLGGSLPASMEWCDGRPSSRNQSTFVLLNTSERQRQRTAFILNAVNQYLQTQVSVSSQCSQ